MGRDMEFIKGNTADTILKGGRPDAQAVLQGATATSYQTLRNRVHQTACTLLDRSVKGDRIGIIAENSLFSISAYLGTMHAGRVAVPLHGEIQPDLLSHIIQSTEMQTVFISRRCGRRLLSILTELNVRIILEGAPQPDAAAVQMPEIDPHNDLAVILFTSGSTGTPKGVMVTHRNIECNTRDIIEYMELTSSDRAMVVLPFHYCFGASLLHTHLMAGGSVVLNNQFMYPETVLDDMEEKACTGLAGVPSTYQILLRRSTFRKRSLLALRWFQQAGGKLPDPFIEEIRSSFNPVRFFLMYGQTEATARLSYLPPERLEEKLGSIGKGLPSSALEVLKSDDTPVTPGSEETGEIVAHGDNVTKGYWKAPDETAKIFKNGKLYTEDIARIDEDGFIYVLDRARDFIKSGGKRVGTKELKNVISELPDVVQAAVIGTSHEMLGKYIKAYLVIRRDAGLSAEDVRRHIAGRLEKFKIPDSVEFLDSLPKNSAGKVLKPKLRELSRQPA